MGIINRDQIMLVDILLDHNRSGEVMLCSTPVMWILLKVIFC